MFWLPPIDPTPEKLRRRRIWIISLVTLAICAVVFTKPAYRSVKAWRARKLVVTIELESKAQKWQEAFAKAQVAYHMAPQEPEVLRAVARLYTMTGQGQALAFWEQLSDTGRATVDDRYEMVSLALRTGRMDWIDRQLGTLLQASKRSPRALKLAAEYYARKGDPSRAIELCREAMTREPDNSDLQLLLGRYLLGSSVDVDRIAGRKLLMNLGLKRDRQSLDALGILSTLPDLSTTEVTYLIGRFLAHPMAQIEQHIWAYNATTKVSPKDKPVAVSSLIRRYPNPTEDQRIKIGRWFNSIGELGRAVEITPLPLKAVPSRDLLLVHLDAMAGLGRWADVKNLLQRTDLPLETWLRELFMARVARATGKVEESELNWRRVQLDVPDSPEALGFVAQYAEKAGEVQEALKVLRRLTNNPATAHSAYISIIRLTGSSTNTRQLRDMLRTVMQLKPGEPEPQNDFAYLSLLLDQEVVEATRIAQRLQAANPNMLAYRITLALAKIRARQPKEAAALLDLDFDWRMVQPGWQAVHAAALGGIGKSAEARKAATIIPSGKLRIEELELIRAWR